MLIKLMALYSFVRNFLFKKKQFHPRRQPKHKRDQKRSKRMRLFAWHMNDWKMEYIDDYFNDKDIFYFPIKLTEENFLKHWSEFILSQESEFLVWGMNCPRYLKNFSEVNNIRISYIEDGFIRSIALGSSHSYPISLAIDKRAPYFNSSVPSDLEVLLCSFDFGSVDGLLERSRSVQQKILDSSISKYNNSLNVRLKDIYGEKSTHRVLVIGQVEDDASILYGCQRKLSNNDLVRIAYEENPDSEIIYKVHPDVLAGKRESLSDPREVSDIALIVDVPIPITQALETIDHVYTITSLVGFEALLRGIKVTTLGTPFYAGWGLTDDREVCHRRVRKLSLDEVFAVSYLLYPKYLSPSTKQIISAEEAIEELVRERELTKNSIVSRVNE